MCAHSCTRRSVHAEGNFQPVLSFCHGFQGLNPSCQVCATDVLPTEPSCWPFWCSLLFSWWFWEYKKHFTRSDPWSSRLTAVFCSHGCVGVSLYPRKHEVFFGLCGLPVPDLPLALVEDTAVTLVTQHLYTLMSCFVLEMICSGHSLSFWLILSSRLSLLYSTLKSVILRECGWRHCMCLTLFGDGELFTLIWAFSRLDAILRCLCLFLASLVFSFFSWVFLVIPIMPFRNENFGYSVFSKNLSFISALPYCKYEKKDWVMSWVQELCLIYNNCNMHVFILSMLFPSLFLLLKT